MPVGEDQLPHLELAREIARRFTHLYGAYLTEPQAVLSTTPKVIGLDGRKMSKSYGNAIYLSDEPDQILKKVKSMITDPARARATDPGNPEICSVYAGHSVFSPDEGKEIATLCRGGKIGCTACKEKLAARVSDTLAEFRERRRELAAKPGLVDEVLAAGLAKARPEAGLTLTEVRRRMNVE